MKKLELNQMEKMNGGANSAAQLCGIGVGVAIFGASVFGPFAVLGLALCLTNGIEAPIKDQELLYAEI